MNARQTNHEERVFACRYLGVIYGQILEILFDFLCVHFLYFQCTDLFYYQNIQRNKTKKLGIRSKKSIAVQEEQRVLTEKTQFKHHYGSNYQEVTKHMHVVQTC